jgi:importin subunit alpha-1
MHGVGGAQGGGGDGQQQLQAERMQQFKSTVDAEQSTRRRRDQVVQIRRARKQEQLTKRRMVSTDGGNRSVTTTSNGNLVGAASSSSSSSSSGPRTFGSESCANVAAAMTASAASRSSTTGFKEIAEMIHLMNSHRDPSARLEGVMQLRRALSIDVDPPVSQVVGLGGVPLLVQMLGDPSDQNMQFEAAWALTNIVADTQQHTEVVVQAGAVPHFVAMLHSPNRASREQAVWALGNIAGDTAQMRNIVLESGALQTILGLLTNAPPPVPNAFGSAAAWADAKSSGGANGMIGVKSGAGGTGTGGDPSVTMLRNATWTLANLCRNHPPPPLEVFLLIIPTLRTLIYTEYPEVLQDACWAFSYITDNSDNDCVASVAESGVCQKIVELLSHPTLEVQMPALRVVGNIAYNSDPLYSQVIINCNVLHALRLLLNSPNDSLRRETCWALGNLTGSDAGAGARGQLQAVFDANLVQPLLKLLDEERCADVREEIAYTLTNATIVGTDEQVCFLVDRGCVAPLCQFLKDTTRTKLQDALLRALFCILQVGSKRATMPSLGFTGATDAPGSAAAALALANAGVGVNAHAQFVEQAGGRDTLEVLVAHSTSSEIAARADRILDAFFDAKYDNEDGDDSMDQSSFGMGTNSNLAFVPRVGGVQGVGAQQQTFNFGSG